MKLSLNFMPKLWIICLKIGNENNQINLKNQHCAEELGPTTKTTDRKIPFAIARKLITPSFRFVRNAALWSSFPSTERLNFSWKEKSNVSTHPTIVRQMSVSWCISWGYISQRTKSPQFNLVFGKNWLKLCFLWILNIQQVFIVLQLF